MFRQISGEVEARLDGSDAGLSVAPASPGVCVEASSLTQTASDLGLPSMPSHVHAQAVLTSCVSGVLSAALMAWPLDRRFAAARNWRDTRSAAAPVLDAAALLSGELAHAPSQRNAAKRA
eukprot:scaffold277083_cov28-Tisochrysis_lutea.AAC.3